MVLIPLLARAEQEAADDNPVVANGDCLGYLAFWIALRMPDRPRAVKAAHT